MKYYTLHKIYAGLRKCGMPASVTLNSMRLYINEHNLTNNVESVRINEKERLEYIREGTKNLIAHKDLSKIISELKIPVKFSELAEMLE